MTQHQCVQLDHVLQVYHLGYHRGHRPSSIREPPVESATSITVQQFSPSQEIGVEPGGSRCKTRTSTTLPAVCCKRRGRAGSPLLRRAAHGSGRSRKRQWNTTRRGHTTLHCQRCSILHLMAARVGQPAPPAHDHEQGASAWTKGTLPSNRLTPVPPPPSMTTPTCTMGSCRYRTMGIFRLSAAKLRLRALASRGCFETPPSTVV